LAALSAGAKRWAKLDVGSYLRQSAGANGFWMSFHELVAGYPWLTKRFARVMDTKALAPRRNGFAYVPALFVPFAGRLGAGFGFLVSVYIVGVLAAVAIPAYNDYKVRAELQSVVTESQGARDALAHYYESSQQVPDSLSRVGVASALPDGSHLSLDSKRMLLTISTARGELIFVPRAVEGRVLWSCTNGDRIKPAQLPASCRTNDVHR
jgi:type II secretory pathway pseudopilin PulG